jgi:hypothetical protein
MIVGGIPINIKGMTFAEAFVGDVPVNIEGWSRAEAFVGDVPVSVKRMFCTSTFTLANTTKWLRSEVTIVVNTVGM